MNKTLLTALCGLFLSTAGAQQTVKVTLAPVTIDGVVTPGGLLTAGGKTYIAVDALKARGLTVLKANSFGLYRFPNAQGQPLVLRGCLNEWLFNGVDRLRIDSVAWDETKKRYGLRFTLQTPVRNHYWSEHFSDQATAVTYRSGKILQPSKNPIQQIDIVGDKMGDPRLGENNTGTIWVTDPDDTGTDTLIKLVVPTANSQKFGPHALSFDLTCKK